MLPTFIVIGAMKCGTSSLHFYLSLHPEVSMSEVKELNFFERNWPRGLDWYSEQFPVEAPARGESSPNYTKYPTFSGVAERMHSILPDAKLIYLVRDPIERIVSHYIDSYSFGRENGAISTALSDLENNHYANCSKYYMQLQQYLKFYSQSKIMIITAEDLRSDQQRTLEQVFSFLGVDSSFSSPDYARELYTAEDKTRKTRVGYALTGLHRRVGRSALRRYLPSALAAPIKKFNAVTGKEIERPVLDDELRQRLALHLKDDADRLRELTGRRFERWSV